MKMLLPVIDSFIKEVNNLAGDPNSRPFNEELTSCLFVMTNETNPVNLGCKFFMLNISLSVLRKILTYLTILKLRSDSLRSSDGEPINQTALTLALNGIVQAIGREEEPISKWKTIVKCCSTCVKVPTTEHSQAGDKKKPKNSFISQDPVPSTSNMTPSSPIPIPGRIVRQSSSNRSSRNSTDSQKSIPGSGTSKQSILYKQNRSEICTHDESTPGKQVARGLHAPIRGQRPGGRRGRGRTSSVSSTSSASPLSVLVPSPSSEPRPDSFQLVSTTATISRPTAAPFTSVIVSPGPSSSNFGANFSSISSSTSAPTTPTVTTSTTPIETEPPTNQPTYGLIVPFPQNVSVPIRQGLIRVLEPFRDKILASPICGNFLFIKLNDNDRIYFIKRQLEIVARLMPKMVVTKLSRYQLDVPKQLAPSIAGFVALHSSILKGEYYVYSRISTLDENITTFEIFANSECQKSIESKSCLFSIAGEEFRAVPILRRYQECSKCFFCYDNSHPECSQESLMEIDS